MPSPTPTPAPTFWLATKNRGKTQEFKLLFGKRFTLRDLYALPHQPDIAETGRTFLANAQIKALTLSEALPGQLVLADDSGLVVPALGGHPGVRSARYAGPHSTPEKNRLKLLRKMSGLHGAARKAYFQATLVLAKNGCVLGAKSARVWGRICQREQGLGGFGYDSVFQPRGYEKTFGELSAATKKRLSHRGRAARAILRLLSREIARSASINYI